MNARFKIPRLDLAEDLQNFCAHMEIVVNFLQYGDRGSCLGCLAAEYENGNETREKGSLHDISECLSFGTVITPCAPA